MQLKQLRVSIFKGVRHKIMRASKSRKFCPEQRVYSYSRRMCVINCMYIVFFPSYIACVYKCLFIAYARVCSCRSIAPIFFFVSALAVNSRQTSSYLLQNIN